MSNEKEISAVEWLACQPRYHQLFSIETIEQAKWKEKKQHETTWIAALDFAINNLKGLNNLSSEEAFEKFYNETYGGNK